MKIEFDPCRQACTCRQSRETHGLTRIARTAGVWQKKKTCRIDKIQTVRKRIVFAGNVSAPQRYCHQLSPAGNERVAHQLVGGEFSRANDQARSEFAIGNLQFGGLVRHGNQSMTNRGDAKLPVIVKRIRKAGNQEKGTWTE